MVQTLMVPCRSIFQLEDFLTIQHVEVINKIILLTGTLVGYAYSTEFFIAGAAAANTKGSLSLIVHSVHLGGPTG